MQAYHKNFTKSITIYIVPFERWGVWGIGRREIGNQRSVISRRKETQALFPPDQIFHPRRDFIVFQQFTAIRLREADFDLPEKPFVVTDQTLHRFLHQGLGVAALFRGNAGKLCLYLWRKFNFHSASLGAWHGPIKAFPGGREVGNQE
jgi:hypothetical protein